MRRQFKQQAAKQVVVLCPSALQLALFCSKFIGNQPPDVFGYWREEEILIIF